MAKYAITGPDGSSYEIDAPNDAAAQAAISQVFSKPKSTPSKLSNTLGAAQSALQGMTMNWADEATAAIGAPIASLASQFTDAPMGVKEAYQKTKPAAQELYAPQRQFAEDHPYMDLALQVAGGVGTGAGAVKGTKAVAPGLIEKV